ncbi:MAG: hypothetical protein AB7H97_04010 [Pseudobdellovibrionaceae bacterium]
MQKTNQQDFTFSSILNEHDRMFFELIHAKYASMSGAQLTAQAKLLEQLLKLNPTVASIEVLSWDEVSGMGTE